MVNPVARAPFSEQFTTRFHYHLEALERKIEAPSLVELRYRMVEYLTVPAANPPLPQTQALLRLYMDFQALDDLFGTMFADLQSKHFRTKAEKEMQYSLPGTWVLRPSSVKNQPEIRMSCRALTYSKPTHPQEPQNVQTCHAVLVHREGHGYGMGDGMITSSSSLETIAWRPNLSCCCLFDLLEALHQRQYIDRTRFLYDAKQFQTYTAPSSDLGISFSMKAM
jgi:hypothetical protein